MPESLVDPNPHIRVFFTGLLAMSYHKGWPNIVVGLQNGREGHRLNMVIFENFYEEQELRLKHLKQGLPIFLPDPPAECDITLNVRNGHSIEMMGHNPDHAIVFDSLHWHGIGENGSLIMPPDPYKARFYINSGKIYTALYHPNLYKVRADDCQTISPAIAFGVDISLPPSSSATLYYNATTQFEFDTNSKYEIFVTCKPPYSATRSAEFEETDFLHHYRAFNIPDDERYNIVSKNTDYGPVPGVSYRNPCVPIFLENTEIG